jgi:hypothetical protein
MSAPHGYCRTCRKERRARPVELGGDRYWICGRCSDFLIDVSWEPVSRRGSSMAGASDDRGLGSDTSGALVDDSALPTARSWRCQGS